MHFKRTSLVLSFFVLVLVVLVVGVVSRPIGGKAQGSNMTSNDPGGPSINAKGASAITPHLVSKNGTNASPAFTETDVRQFITQNGMPNGLVTENGKPPTVSEVLFITAKQANNIMTTSIGRPDDTLVCYVVVKGPFVANVSVPVNTDQQGNVKPYTSSGAAAIMKVEMVFDAQTGNLILFRIPPPSQQH